MSITVEQALDEALKALEDIAAFQYGLDFHEPEPGYYWYGMCMKYRHIARETLKEIKKDLTNE